MLNHHFEEEDDREAQYQKLHGSASSKNTEDLINELNSVTTDGEQQLSARDEKQLSLTKMKAEVEDAYVGSQYARQFEMFKESKEYHVSMKDISQPSTGRHHQKFELDQEHKPYRYQRRPVLSSQSSTSNLGADHHINYKTIEKVPLQYLSDAAIQKIELAIKNVDGHKPQNNRSAVVPLITQKQLVNSLERTLNPNIDIQEQKIDHLEKAELILYRWLLKIHRHFIEINKFQQQEQPLDLQMQHLLGLYRQVILQSRQNALIANQFHRNNLLQKAFIGLLACSRETMETIEEDEPADGCLEGSREDQLKIVENESEGLLGKRTSRMHLKFDVADDTDDQEILQVAQVIESSDTYRQQQEQVQRTARLSDHIGSGLESEPDQQQELTEQQPIRPQLKSILKGPTSRASESNPVSGSKKSRVVDDSPVRRFLDDDEEPEEANAKPSARFVLKKASMDDQDQEILNQPADAELPTVIMQTEIFDIGSHTQSFVNPTSLTQTNPIMSKDATIEQKTLITVASKSPLRQEKEGRLLELEAVRQLQTAVQIEQELIQELEQEHGHQQEKRQRLLKGNAIASNFNQETISRRVFTALRKLVWDLHEARDAASSQIAVRVTQAQQSRILAAWRNVVIDKQLQEEKLVHVMRQLWARKLALIFERLRDMIDANKEKLQYSLDKHRIGVLSTCMEKFARNASMKHKLAHLAGQFVAQKRHRQLKFIALRVLYNELLEAKSPEVHDAQQQKIQKMRDRKANKCMAAWRYLTEQDSSLRRIRVKVMKKHKMLTRARVLTAWTDLWREVRLGCILRRQALHKKVFDSLALNIKMKERKQLLQAACCQHIDRLRLKNVFKALDKHMKAGQAVRKRESVIAGHMDRVRLRQCMKAWFNLIDIMQRWRFVNENTALWYRRKRLKMLFRAWKFQTDIQVRYFQVKDQRILNLGKRAFHALKLAHERTVNMNKMRATVQLSTKRQLLVSWYKLLSHKLRGQLRLAKRRQFTLMSASFDALLCHCERRKRFRRQMRKLLETRAQNLLYKSWKFGLKRHWVVQSARRRVKLTALKFCKEHRLTPCFRALQRVRHCNVVCLRQQKLNSVKALEMRTFNGWLTVFNRLKNERKFIADAKVNRIRAFVQQLKNLIKRKNDNQVRLEEYLQRRRAYLATQILRQGSKYAKQKTYLRKKHDKLVSSIGTKVKTTIVAALRAYADKKIFKKARWNKAATFNHGRLTSLAWYALVERAWVKHTSKRLIFEHKLKTKHRVWMVLVARHTALFKGKVVERNRNMRVRRRCFDAFARYTAYKKSFREKTNQVLTEFNYNTKVRVIEALRRRVQLSKIAKVVQQKVNMKRCIVGLRAWRELLQEAIEEGPQRHLAMELFMRHKLHQLLRAARTDQAGRRGKAKLCRLSVAFWERNSKQRAIRHLLKHSQFLQMQRLRQRFAQRIHVKKLFLAWFDMVGHLKRKRLLKESALLTHQNGLLEKTLGALREYADKRIKNRLIVERFQERSELVLKAEVLAKLHRNIAVSQTQKNAFYEKTVFLAQRRLAEPFLQWVRYVLESRLEARADKFFLKRKAAFLKRLAIDSLRIYCLQKLQKNVQKQAIDNWNHRNIKQKVLMSFKLNMHNEKRLRNCEGIIAMQSDQFRLQAVFRALKDACAIRRAKTKLKGRAHMHFQRTTLRNCLNALKVGCKHGERERIIEEKRRKRIRRECALKWHKALLMKRQLFAMTEILQAEHDCRTVNKFFPKLIKETYILQIYDHMQHRRLQNYQIEFINQVRKQILMRKISESFRRRAQLELKRAIIVELRVHALQGNHARELLADRAEEVEEQNERDVMQTVFNCLRERVVLRKFKTISANCHRLRTLKKCFMALQRYDLSKKLERAKVEEIKSIQRAKYLWMWRRAYALEKEKNQVGDYLKSTWLYQVLDAWRAVTKKQVRAKAFHKNVVRRNQLRNIMHGWALQIKIKQRDQELCKYMRAVHENNAQRHYLLEWILAYADSRQGKKADEHRQLTLLAKVFADWKQIRARKNAQRQAQHFIKMRLAERPELARPLLALKNFTLFKAFNKLVVGAKTQYTEEHKEESALFAYYLKITKKAFLSLKLGAQLQIQQNQTEEMADLFMKKRFFAILLRGTFILKEQRKVRHKASIFRFLALQRRALLSMSRYVELSREHRVKNDCALRLYFRHTIHKTFSVLKAYAAQKKVARAERIERQLQNEDEQLLSPSILQTQQTVNERSSMRFRSNQFGNIDWSQGAEAGALPRSRSYTDDVDANLQALGEGSHGEYHNGFHSQQFGGTSMFPSVGAINHFGYPVSGDQSNNIFNQNYSYGSGSAGHMQAQPSGDLTTLQTCTRISGAYGSGHPIGNTQQSIQRNEGNISQQMLIMRGDEESCDSDRHRNIVGADKAVKTLSRGSSRQGSGAKKSPMHPRGDSNRLRDNCKQMPNSKKNTISSNCRHTNEAFHESDDVMTLCAPQRPPLAPDGTNTEDAVSAGPSGQFRLTEGAPQHASQENIILNADEERRLDELKKIRFIQTSPVSSNHSKLDKNSRGAAIDHLQNSRLSNQQRSGQGSVTGSRHQVLSQGRGSRASDDKEVVTLGGSAMHHEQ